MKILVVDDNEAICSGLCELLERDNPDYSCESASDGNEALLKAKASKPDVVILDFSMPRMGGLSSARLISRRLPGTRILLHTAHRNDMLETNASRYGVFRVVEKIDGQNLLAVIREIDSNPKGQGIVPMTLKAIAFDFGHTLVDERTDPIVESQPIHLMPEVLETLPRISSPMAIWANTGTAVEIDLRRFLDRAGIGQFFTWIVTSVDAGYRKPAPEFFDFALSKCGLSRDQVLFVGNQLNTDILGGSQYGIHTVWLSGRAYRSGEDTLSLKDVQPTYKLASLYQLPALVLRIRASENS